MGPTFDHVLSGMFVGERRETAELFALAVKDNVVRRRTLVPRLEGVDEWGYRGEDQEVADRTTYLAARRARFAAAMADDLRRVG